MSAVSSMQAKRSRFSLWDQIALDPTSRGITVGQTGCGKTTLSRFLTREFPRVLCIDVKDTLEWPGFERYTSLKKMVAETNGKAEARAIYAPNASELRDETFHDAFFRYAYESRDTFCYVDEVYGVAFRDELPPHYHAILTRGRERGCGLLSSTQRPTKIPSVIMSETEFWYVFRLSMPGDRKKVEETVGIDEQVIGGMPKHHFIFTRADTDERIGPLTLNIKKG